MMVSIDRFGFPVAHFFKVRSWLLLFVWSISLQGVSYAQSSSKPTSATTVQARDDRDPLRIRQPEEDHLRDLQTDHDYQYGNDAPPSENPIARFFEWFFRKLSSFFNSKAYENIWQYVLLVAIASVAIYLLMKAEVIGFLFPKKAESGELDYENLAENIHQLDFDQAIDDAIQQRNFRLTVRLLYLQALKRLTDSNRIQYQPDKTNRQYVHELANSPLQPDFETLTRQFEFIWYGDFPIDEPQLTNLRHQFQQFGLAIQRKSTTSKA